MKVNYKRHIIFVRFIHINHTKEKKVEQRKTICSIQDEIGNILAYGETLVNPKDNFNKAIGRNLALKRATDRNSKLEGELIGLIWERYNKRK